MALRLKRGTNAERLNYTPELGELIYVTDYSTENVSPLWIGDGSTMGGNAITGNGGTEVVSDTAPQLGGNLDLNGFNIVGNGDIDTNGNVDITGNLLAGSIAASSISGNFDGDLSGSVFGDDSTKIIDGVNNIIQAKLFQSSDNLVSFGNGSDVSSSIVSIQSTNQQGVLDLKRISESDLTGIDTINYGMIRFSRDDVNGSGIKGIIVGRENAILFSSSSLGLFTDPTDYFSFKEKKFGIGTITPEETLDVNGNAIISGSLEADAILLSGSTIDTSDSSAINVVPATTFNSDVTVENNLTVTNTLTVDTLEVTNFQTAGNGTPELESDTDILLTAGTRVEVTQSPLAMASFTTTERNALTPQNGDVIYNTTDNKFQGYANGLWEDIILNDLGNLANVSSATASAGQVLKWNGSQWAPASDNVGDGSGGIALTDLSVTTNPAGSAALSYDNSTGTFTYTPPDIGPLSYTADTGNNLLYADGTYDFGSNIIKYANAIDQEADLANYDPGAYHGMTMHVHSTGGLYYAHAGAWRKLLTDVDYNDVEGAGYVNPLSDYAYTNTNPIGSSDINFGANKILFGNVYANLGDLPDASTYHGMFAHVHATGKAYFAHAGAWIPLANESALPTDLTDLGITDGSNGQVLTTDGAGNFSFTTVTSGGSGILNVVEDTTPQLGGTLDANGNTIDMGTNTITDQKVGWWDTAYGWGDHSTQGYLTSETFTSVVQDTTPQLGGDLDVNANSIQYTFNVTNNGTSDYTFSDTGNHWFPSAENDPVLYLRRGETYVFDVNASGHPFEIRTSSGGSAYNTGVTNNGAQVGQITFKVPMSAPSTLYYICTIHSSMGNTINIV